MENEEEKKPAALKKEDERKNFLSATEELVKRNEEILKQMQELTERNEELAARKLLGGKSDAGIQPEPVKEETPQEYAKKVISGEIKPTD